MALVIPGARQSEDKVEKGSVSTYSAPVDRRLEDTVQTNIVVPSKILQDVFSGNFEPPIIVESKPVPVQTIDSTNGHQNIKFGVAIPGCNGDISKVNITWSRSKSHNMKNKILQLCY